MKQKTIFWHGSNAKRSIFILSVLIGVAFVSHHAHATTYFNTSSSGTSTVASEPIPSFYNWYSYGPAVSGNGTNQDFWIGYYNATSDQNPNWDDFAITPVQMTAGNYNGGNIITSNSNTSLQNCLNWNNGSPASVSGTSGQGLMACEINAPGLTFTAGDYLNVLARAANGTNNPSLAFDNSYSSSQLNSNTAEQHTIFGCVTDSSANTFSCMLSNSSSSQVTISLGSFNQYQSDATTFVGEGNLISANSVAITGQVDSNGAALLQLQLEVRKVGDPFTGVPNASSTFVSPGGSATAVFSGENGGYHWQIRASDAQGNHSAWSTLSDPAVAIDFALRDPASNLILHDTTGGFGISSQGLFSGCPDGIFSCALSPEFKNYMVGTSFSISKITFDWANNGSNNCTGAGNYGAIITSANLESSVIATSTNTSYLGCAGFGGNGGGTRGVGELNFIGQVIPSNFYLTFGAFDGGVQGGSAIVVDNVRIYSSPKIEPTIIIPGIFGSVYKNGQWILQPVFKPYDTLKATFVANGYVQDKTLFDFPYDWEHASISVIAHELKDKIQTIKSICTCSKVDIVAHSMGGLVVRQYVENSLYQNDIDHLIFLGTPQLGASEDYLAWEGGTPGFNGEFDLENVYLKAVMYQEAREAGFGSSAISENVTIFNYIHSTSSPIFAFQELLPTYNYLRDANSILRTYPNGYPQNSFLDNLNTPSSLALFGQSGIKTTTIYSNEQTDTLNVIDIKHDSSTLPLWSEGIPQSFELSAGDGTVPQNSATAINASNTFEVGGTHVDLPTTADAKIIQILTGITNPVIAPPPSLLKKFLSIFPFSPVDVLVTAPSGLKIGKDFSTGQEINQIPGAYYSGFDTPNENIFIPDPEDGVYSVATQGTGAGAYNILTSYGYEASSSATSSDLTFVGNTQSGLVQNLDLTVNSSTPTANTIRVHGLVVSNIPLTGDTYIDAALPTKNFGTSTVTKIGGLGDARALYVVSSTAIQKIIGSSTLVQAFLRLPVAINSGTWTLANHSLKLYRMTQRWTETGATWKCPDALCAFDWYPTSTAAVTATSTSKQVIVDLDVTQDIKQFLAGTVPNYGWLFKLANETGTASLNFFAKGLGSTTPLMQLKWETP